MTWNKETIDKFVEDNGGCAFALVDNFPFNDEEKRLIQEAYNIDYIPMTDSELCDYILELAYKHIENKYSIWVGGIEVNDYYLPEEKANQLAEEYKAQGYDDVQVTKN